MNITHKVKRPKSPLFPVFMTFWSIFLSRPQYIPPEYRKYTYIVTIKICCKRKKIFFRKGKSEIYKNFKKISTQLLTVLTKRVIVCVETRKAILKRSARLLITASGITAARLLQIRVTQMRIPLLQINGRQAFYFGSKSQKVNAIFPMFPNFIYN